MDFYFFVMNIEYFASLYTGGVGIVNMIENIEQKEYMGFENLCTYEA